MTAPGVASGANIFCLMPASVCQTALLLSAVSALHSARTDTLDQISAFTSTPESSLPGLEAERSRKLASVNAGFRRGKLKL